MTQFMFPQKGTSPLTHVTMVPWEGNETLRPLCVHDSTMTQACGSAGADPAPDSAWWRWTHVPCLVPYCVQHHQAGSGLAPAPPRTWYHHERASTSEEVETKMSNKVIIFVFFAQKKHPCSFVKLQLKDWCHLYSISFVDNLGTFMALERGSTLAVYWRVKVL